MAKTTHGATVALGATTLAAVTNVKIPNLSRGMIDVSNHGTTTAKEFIPEDLYEMGDFVVTMDYIAGSTTDDACISALTSSPSSPVAVTVTVKAATGTEDVEFNAFGVNYEIQDLPAASADKQQAVLTMKPTGARTQAPTA